MLETVGGVAENRENVIDLMSYDDYALQLLVKDDDLRKGSDISKVAGDGGGALVIWDRDMPLQMGDKIRIGETELEIDGMLKYSPFSNSGSTDGKMIVIVSAEMFTHLTGITDYIIVEAQMAGRRTGDSDAAVEQIRKLSAPYEFRDRRNEDTSGIFYTFLVFVYGFIVIIAGIALLNIMNSVSMSVMARMSQYGAMRAIGMGVEQMTRMILAEALTYAACGCVVGCAAGLPLSKLLFDRLVTSHFYYFTWSVPVGQIVVILVFVFASALIAVYAPSRRIRQMSVTDTIHAQ